MSGLTALPSECQEAPPGVPAAPIDRTRRIYSAWGASFTSKIATLLVQLVSIPAAYRSLGAEAFAAYAGVTSVMAVLWFFHLGLGGAMVSPLASASAARDVNREREVVAAALLPLVSIALIIGMIALPTLAVLPLPTLFGEASTAVTPHELRTAALLACTGTLAALPLSVVGHARQAYQELHISYAVGTGTNILMFVGILAVALLSPTLLSFVAVRVLVPVVGQAADACILLYRRPYLLDVLRFFSLVRAKALAGDGLFYLGATSTHALLYQWPVYLMTRMRTPAESARFAVCIQVVLISLSFFFNLLQPLWGATVDACAVGDHSWVRSAIARVRIAALVYGLGAALGFGLLLNFLVTLWLRKPISFQTPERWLAGCYVLLAGWEYGHWVLCLGLGQMKPASIGLFCRAALFSAVAPIAARLGTEVMLCALCASVLSCTSWYFPRLVSRSLKGTYNSAAMVGD